MRIAKLVLAAVCVAALLAASNAWAAVVINPVNAVASSEYGVGTGDYRSALKTIDGSGLNGPIPADDSAGLPTAHTWPPGESWVDAPVSAGGNGDGSAWIYYDLGSQKEVGALAVWNANDSISSIPIDQTYAGAKDVDVLYSNDAVNWTAADSFVFTRATPFVDNPAEILQLSSAVTAQYMKLDIHSCYEVRDPAYGVVGLKHVAFLDGSAAVPEPSTIVLLAAGLIGLLCYAWRKRK